MTGRLPEGQSEENMRQDEIIIRAMEIEDYDQVRSLWMTIRGFGIRSIDDSREEIARFLKRNPTTSVVAEKDFYHVCVAKALRRRGIGRDMVIYCMNALRAQRINKVALIAFTKNDAGNAFWRQIGWKHRQDLNYYDFVLNEENITRFIESES